MLQDRDERPERVSAEALQSQLDGELQKIQGALIGYQPQASSFGGGGGRTGGRGGRTGGSGGFNLQAGATSETALLKGYDFAVLQMIADDLSYRLEELAEIDANSVRPDLQRSAPEIQVIPRPAGAFRPRPARQHRPERDSQRQSRGLRSADGFSQGRRQRGSHRGAADRRPRSRGPRARRGWGHSSVDEYR